MTKENNNVASATEQTPFEKGKTLWELHKKQQEAERQKAIQKQKEFEERKKKEQEQVEKEREEEFKIKKEFESARKQLIFDKYLSDFEPKQIGEADYTRDNEIYRNYKFFCKLINKCRLDLAAFFEMEGNYGLTETTEFIKSNPQKWLPGMYIETKKIQIPEWLNKERVIEEKLVTYPETLELVSLHSQIMSAWQKIKSTGFIFPFQKLYDEERDLFSIEFNLEFGESISNFLAIRTTTPEQNVVLGIIERLLESLEDLSALRIIKLEKGPGELQRIERFFKFKGRSFDINPFIFHRDPSLKQYGPVESSQNMNLSLEDFLK
ncbi:hypothetical protein GM418_10950 [Maribellus comscasis]|uniref:Uncharacterized protein n=1 Tax=Maribellus comscasis TaxID=2681766 RepID=A0A6I6JVQ4_9BACT|nr:hypothetical protein [Maribellus comscasis]QGY44157.1 hypothetical protein GM418_10950 [Maribellus comscasis]